MEVVPVPNCPISGRPGVVEYIDARDAFFGTEGCWTYKRDTGLGHLWLDPRPADACIGSLYSNYYTHSETSRKDPETLWERSIAMALSRRLEYPRPSKAGKLARLVSFLPSVAAAAELEMMRIRASETGHLLDVGCGSGTFLRRMLDAGWTVMGVEPDTNAAARLRARSGIRIYGSLDEIAAQGNLRFDVITVSHVIEHVADPLRLLEQLRGLLSETGRLIITTPNSLSLGARIFGARWRGLEPPRHFNVFSPTSLPYALQLVGLKTERMTTEVRLARGIFFASALARFGKTSIEGGGVTSPLLKVIGYCFQMLEAATVGVYPNLGEELYCVAVRSDADAKQVR